MDRGSHYLVSELRKLEKCQKTFPQDHSWDVPGSGSEKGLEAVREECGVGCWELSSQAFFSFFLLNMPCLQELSLPPDILPVSPNLAFPGVLEQISIWELGKPGFKSRLCCLFTGCVTSGKLLHLSEYPYLWSERNESSGSGVVRDKIETCMLQGHQWSRSFSTSGGDNE